MTQNQELSEQDVALIATVKKYPDVYYAYYTKEEKEGATFSIWKTIATEINLKDTFATTAALCKKRWIEIQDYYKKIKSLIRADWTLESILLVHPKTRMYLNGSLRFLDAGLKKIHFSTITASTHKCFEWIEKYYAPRGFLSDSEPRDSTLVTQDMVQALLAERKNVDDLDGVNMKYLMEVADNTVTQCLLELENKKENCINWSLDHVIQEGFSVDSDDENELEELVNQSNDSDQTQSADEAVFEPLEMNDDSIYYFESDNSYIDNVVINETNPTLDVEVNHETSPDVLASILPVSNVYSGDTIDIKTYFDELADMVSNKLSLEKQQILRQRVNLLIEELLKENDNN